MPTRDCILLYNPISNEGHLDSWHVLFIEAFLNAGWAVLAMTSDLAGLQSKLMQKGLADHQSLSLYNISSDNAASKSQTSSLIKQAKKIAIWLEAKTEIKLGQWLRNLKGAFQATEKREQAALALKHLDPQLFCDQVNQVLSQHSNKVTVVFNMYVDAYMPTPNAWQQFGFVSSTPWMSLCITPDQLLILQGDVNTLAPYYSMADYRGTCFLDEALLERYQVRWPDKQFEYLPDITETALPPQPTLLAEQIKQQAAGRKIVFMGGSIGKQKNLAQWVTLIQQADSAQWYFVQIGRLNINNLTTEDRTALASLQATAPKNLYSHDGYLSDELAFNDVIAVADVIFAVYKDFYRSSNMLSKAAYFEKPILVASNCLMGMRVTKYGIGLAVAPNDSQAICQGLNDLLHLPNLATHFAAYRQDFNQQALQNKLVGFVRTCLEQWPPTMASSAISASVQTAPSSATSPLERTH
jgi:hypothetical protein